MIDAAAKKLRSKLAELRGVLPDARRRYAELQEEISANRARADYLRSAPLNVADTRAQLLQAITAAQAEALKSGDLEQSIDWIARSAGNAITGDDPASLSPIRAPKLDASGASLLTLLVDPAAAVARLEPVITGMATEASPSLEDRRAELRALARRLEELAEERRELESAMTLAGEDMDDYAPRPVKPGPRVGDKLPAVKDHHGRMVEATWIRRPVGNTGHYSEGWHWHAPDNPPDY